MAVIGAPLVRRQFVLARRRPRPIEGALTFPDVPLRVQFEVAPGADLTAIPGTWVFTDIANYVLLRDGGISITVGRAEGATTTEPSTLSALWKNPAGIWTRTNPNSPYSGLLSRNLPAQLSVDPGTGPIVRARQYVTSLPPRWDPSDNDKYMPVAAAGVLRRLGQGSSADRSTVTATALTLDPVAYWPCGDASGAASAASALSGGSPMSASGASFAADTGCPGAPSLVSLPVGAYLAASVPAYTADTEWSVMFLVRIAEPPTTTTELGSVYTTGTISRWTLQIVPATPPTPDSMYLRGYNAAGAVLVTATATMFDDVIGEPSSMYGDDYISVRISAMQVGSSVTGQYGLVTSRWTGSAKATVVDGAEATVASQTIGNVTRVVVGAAANTTVLVAGEVGVHRALANVQPAGLNNEAYSRLSDSMIGYQGETATARAVRICDELGVDLAIDDADGLVFGHPTDQRDLALYFQMLGDELGAQPLAGPVTVLREAEAADESMLAEDGFGLRWQQRTSRYYLTPALELDYAQGHITDIQPADDDRRLLNDWTLNQSSGSSGRFVDDASVAAEGHYGATAQVNLSDATDLVRHAAWRVHLGTDDGLRYPVIVLDFAANPGLIDAWSRCKVGSRVTIANPPASLPPDLIDLIIEGWTERIGFKVWTVSLVCSPYRPWEVWTIGDDQLGRLDATDTVLAADITAGATSFQVTTTTAPQLSTSAGDYPCDIAIRGERVRITAVSSATSPQTLTVTRSINGVSKSHPAGTPIQLWHPGVIAL